jgi:hypothetical protein
MTMKDWTRRNFMKTSLAAVGSATLASYAWSQVRGANDNIRIAVVGVRKKGKEHIQDFYKLSGVRVVAICDADTQWLDAEVAKFKERNITVDTYQGITSRGMDRYRGINFGMVIQCEHSYFSGGRGGGWTYDNNGKKIKQYAGDGGWGHMTNFLDTMRSRRVSDLKDSFYANMFLSRNYRPPFVVPEVV